MPRARQEERRSNDEIIAEALSVIRPTAAHRDACRTELEARIGLLRRHGREKPPSAAQYKEKLNDYLKALRTARKKFPYFPEPLSESDAEFAEFDAHVRFQVKLENDINYINKMIARLAVRPGSNPPDLWAIFAVDYARQMLRDAGRPVPLTREGHWERLAQLLYEAANGQRTAEKLWKYMRRMRSSA